MTGIETLISMFLCLIYHQSKVILLLTNEIYGKE